MGNLWRERSPVFLGPVKFVEGMVHRGGGRGVIATSDIAPGTLLIAEAPYLKWPNSSEDDPLNVAMLKKILNNNRREKILSDLSRVHPTSVDIVPLDLIQELEAQFGSHLDKLLALYSSFMKRNDLIRLFLVLQCSAHSTGLYLYLSLFNHESRPNAIKFAPAGISNASEMRAVREIKKGDEITFSYLEPRERTRAKQYLLLRKQFGFVPSFDDITRDELTERWKNPDTPDLDFVLKLEEDLDEFAAGASLPPLNTLKQLRTRAVAILDPRHVLLLRLNKLLIDAVMPFVSGEREDEVHENGEVMTLAQAIAFYLECSYEVYKTQLVFLPKDHIDIATTLHDLSQGIESLLSENKALLFKTFPQWDNFQKATKFQQFYQAQFQRLDSMYS